MDHSLAVENSHQNDGENRHYEPAQTEEVLVVQPWIFFAESYFFILDGLTNGLNRVPQLFFFHEAVVIVCLFNLRFLYFCYWFDVSYLSAYDDGHGYE